MKSICLKTQEIKKRFGGVKALTDGTIEIRTGEVLALVGSNGSGKSTLAKIITGVLPSDDGQVIYQDEVVQFPNPMAAQKAGIMAVYQDLSLVPSLTVAENIWLANEHLTKAGFINNQAIKARTVELLDVFAGTYQSSLHPDAFVSSLPPDEKQIVEILKAVSRDPDVLIFDEATASLDSNQVDRLFDLINDLKSQNKGLVFISHRMDEIFQIADRTVVLRNGRTVGDAVISETDEAEIVQMMIGTNQIASNGITDDEEITKRETILEIEDIENYRLNGVSFSVKEGELVGIGGLRGQGQSSLLRTLFGDEPFTGKTTFYGEEIKFNHPKDAMRKGIALIPGDRAAEGLLLIRSILENFHLPNWRNYASPILNMKKAYRDASEVSDQLNLVMENLDSPISTLSGGNAQKVVIGKWLLRKPKLLLLDDPTKGVDVGTKAEFYYLLKQLSIEGTTILFYSSDDQELLDLCPRILVMQDGKIKADLSGDTLTEANLVSSSMGAQANTNNAKETEHA